MFVDMQRRPRHYENLVRGIREHLATYHTQVVRLQELIDIIES
jgi:ferritin-like metal-binding protein YciE